MTALKIFTAAVIFIIVAALDIKGKYPPLGRFGGALELTLLPHCFLISAAAAVYIGGSTAGIVGLSVVCGVFFIYRLIKMSVKPYCKRVQTGVRVRALYGGKILMEYSLFSAVFQGAFYIVCVKNSFFGMPRWLILTDIISAAVIFFGFCLNGLIRILVCCRRLNIVKRIIVFLLLFVPVGNLAAMWYMHKIAGEEYDFEETRAACDRQRVESQVCATKYPILLLHGIGFRDRRYFNYWGRVPRELIRNGAKIYYGMQDGCVTVEYGAEQVKKKLEEILAETGCEKVNIIAHSKGGLDARYLISTLGMAEHVASLTTVATPHHGSQVADEAMKLSDGLYRKVAGIMDKSFRKLGDAEPDFYTACHQFTSEYAEQFNKDNPDSDKVYYQSCTSVMSSPFSFGILAFTYMIMRKYGENDGLVTVESSKWGNFMGVYRPTGVRGISHGDTIDLAREDYKGYDPREEYIKIAAGLKEMGF